MKTIQLTFMTIMIICAVLLSVMCLVRGYQYNHDWVCYAFSTLFAFCASIAIPVARYIYHEK